jgi:hypothetical protein
LTQYAVHGFCRQEVLADVLSIEAIVSDAVLQQRALRFRVTGWHGFELQHAFSFTTSIWRLKESQFSIRCLFIYLLYTGHAIAVRRCRENTATLVVGWGWKSGSSERGRERGEVTIVGMDGQSGDADGVLMVCSGCGVP